jgi:bifunctional non-homologous end joining protein LigD
MPKPQVSFEGAQPEPLAIKLQYRSAASDKVYQLSLEAASPELWCVNFAFGRRGTTLQTGTKTKTPVSYGEARRIYEKILAEKTGEGYRPFDQTPVPSHQAPAVLFFEGIEPMLCTAIEIGDAERFIRDGQYWMNRKFDGKRILLYRAGDVVAGSNRRRGRVDLPVRVARAALQVPGDWILDGELVGETYWAFDLLAVEGRDMCDEWLSRRTAVLTGLCATLTGNVIRAADWATTQRGKEDLYRQVVETRGEGVVFKLAHSTYRAGRKPTGWPWLKCKFVATATLIAGPQTDKHSIELFSYEGTRLGTVTIPPNKDVPAPGTPCEVRYLYRFPGGSLFQPVYLGPREDIEPEACTEAQLKYKPEEDA